MSETTSTGIEEINLDRGEVLRVIDKTIEMASRAEVLKAGFRFRGD